MMGNVVLFLIRPGIIDLGAFCVELWSFFVSKRISVPMSYITCLGVCAKNKNTAGIEILWDYNYMVVHPISGRGLGQAGYVIKTPVYNDDDER